jgi:uncharacterized membrane protein YhaH (DUF805 family)
MDWALLPFKRFAQFDGRSRRKEYWSFALLAFVASYAIGMVEGVLGLSGMIFLYGPLSLLFGLAILIPSLAVGVRRLHDTGRSGWLILIGLIPILGAIALIYFFVLEGDGGPNLYGSDPKTGDAGQTA